MKKGLMALLVLLVLASACSSPSADLILNNGQVYTGEEGQPWASAVVIKGDEILAVLEDEKEASRYIDPSTRVIDLEGQFVMPGFIDAHVHFAAYAAQQHDIQLMNVDEDDGLVKEIQRVVANVGPNEWIIGGDWSGAIQWMQGRGELDGPRTEKRWEPHRRTIDPFTQQNPCLLNSYERDLFLANTAALRAAGLDDAHLEGMQLDESGQPTGLLYQGSPAIDEIRKCVKPKSEERILNEYRAGLRLMAEMGIVEFHDMFRSFKEVERYLKLQEMGELTCRVWLRPWLDLKAEMFARGFTMGMHPETMERDYFLRFGGFKSANDGFLGDRGAMLFEPYSDRPDYRGHYQEYNSDSDTFGSLVGNPEVFYNHCKDAVEHGYCVDSHAIGDRGVSEVIDVLERIRGDMNADLSMFRIIHAEIIQPLEFARIKALDLIVETNPSQLPDDMRWLIDRLGPERENLAFPFRTFIDKGIIMNFGSDIPGNAGAIFFNDPKFVLNAAVNRTDMDGGPGGGWLPQHKITIEEAIRCFTLNGAYACMREDAVRGTLKAGKLADIVVIDRNIVKNDPHDVMNMQVKMTIVDGRIVYMRE
ncbi:MAG: amidohydrolase [Candidatus Aminicenantaceae bacterium]